jgi:PIN domain nuclease of toxin-antitoxin system
MLVAQALVERFVLVTHDARLARYGAELLEV